MPAHDHQPAPLVRNGLHNPLACFLEDTTVFEKHISLAVVAFATGASTVRTVTLSETHTAAKFRNHDHGHLPEGITYVSL